MVEQTMRIHRQRQRQEDNMQILVNTDRNVEGREALAERVRGVVETSLARFDEHITRVEVHLSDENSNKKAGVDHKRCVIEARLEGRQPFAASHQAPTMGQAVDGATEKLGRMIDSTLGKLRDQRTRAATVPEISE